MKKRTRLTLARAASRPSQAPARRKRKLHKLAALRPAQVMPGLALEVLAAPRIASLLLVLACLAGLIAFLLDERFFVYELSVHGQQYAEAGDIVMASELEGLHVAWVQPGQAASLIVARLPEVCAAHVACELPARCSITVQERQPLFAWRQGQAWVWIDAHGVAFTAHPADPAALVIDMPSGPLPLPGQHVDAELVAGVASLASWLPDLRLLRYTDEHGLEFSDPGGGWPVYLGRGPGLEARLAVWQALSENLRQRGIRPAYVDVRYALAPYYATQ